jgi:RNA polymerase sigma-70 factor (ECF subfamily)
MVDGAGLDRYRAYLTLLARTQLGGRFDRRLDASDIVQTTLLEAHQKMASFRGDAPVELAGWLRAILVNNVADAIRAQVREKRDIRRERSLEANIEDSFARADAWLASEQSSPSQQLMRSEQQVALADAIACLPPDQADAIVHYHLRGMSLRELAEYFARSEPAVAGLLHRGLKQLRQMMQRERG